MRAVQYFNGVKFLRRQDGYYEGKVADKKILMHRYVWIFYNGPIPINYIIHHKDEDKGNNIISNLECLSNEEHSRYHGKNKSPERLVKDIYILKTKAQKKAIEWHKSEEGRAWAKKNAQDLVKRGLINPKVSYICENCGKEFLGVKRKAKHKFCSGACQQKYRRAHKLNNEIRKCIICGNEFSTDKYGNTKTCSRSCGMKLAHINNPTNWRIGETNEI